MSRARLRSERGEIGLIQLLVALAVGGMILGATLTVFTAFVKEDRELNARNDAQEQARMALDRLARDLRNLASPKANLPQAVDRAGARDLIFKTVNTNGPNAGLNPTNVQRVRYCLDDTAPGNSKLVAQVQTWDTADPPAYPDTACGQGWTTTTVLAQNITNYAGGQTRPLFTYNAPTLSDITSIHADLRVDLQIGRGAKETDISTGVFLRNQNRVPTASFDASTNLQGAVLNASASADPEGQPLKYEWFEGDARLGEGVTFLLQGAKDALHTVKLKVSDPAGLTAEQTRTDVRT